MKNNFVALMMMILVGIICGFALLLGINSAINIGLLPLHDSYNRMTVSSTAMDQKVDALTAQVKALNDKVDQIVKAIPPSRQPTAAIQQQPQEDLNKVYDIPVGGSVIVGKKDAPITIVEFNDLQCPYCKHFWPPVKEALAKYPNDVRFIIKHYPLPFHPNARPAAKMAMAANEQGKFIEMVELLLNSGADVSEGKVREYAKALDINFDRLMSDLQKNDEKYEAQLAEDAKLLEPLQVRGTPTFFINGRKAQVRDFAGFKAEIDRILAQK